MIDHTSHDRNEVKLYNSEIRQLVNRKVMKVYGIEDYLFKIDTQIQ
jgi:hypothetical protein